MAKLKVVNEPKYTLELSEEEAMYLRGLTQNFLGAYHEGELASDRSIREVIFTTLNQGLFNDG